MLSLFRHLDALLRGDRTERLQLKDGARSLPLSVFVPWAVGLGGLYGFFVGWFALGTGRPGALLHVVSTTVKLPLLFLATLLVTFPSLYVFNALVGCRLSFWATLRLLVAAVVVNLAIGASLGPILGFFTLSTSNYHFMVLLNVLLLGLAGMISLGFLLRTLRAVASATAMQEWSEARTAAQAGEGDQEARPIVTEAGTTRRTPESSWGQGGAEPAVGDAEERIESLGTAGKIFRVWVIIYGLVGAQMGWILRPFIGAPDQSFAFMRPRDGNFFLSVMQSLRGLFGW